MLLSKTSEYALLLVLYLVSHPAETFTPLGRIAHETGISFFRLSKVAQALIRAGILISYTGPNGGVNLAKPPDRLRLFDVVEALEGPAVFDGCVLGLDQCGEENPCPVHTYWKEAKNVITRMFKEMTLDQFTELELLETLDSGKVLRKELTK
ncbi:MAG: RrF2 family transcriptional regulator [Fidelibacterota bacterium]